MFGFILIELGLPTLLARMIDVGIRNGDREYIWKMGMAMIAITLTGIAMNIMLGYFYLKNHNEYRSRCSR